MTEHDIPVGTVLKRKKDGRIYVKLNHIGTDRDVPWLSPEFRVVYFPFHDITKEAKVVRMYCTTNFKTKKALKAAVVAGKQVRVYSPGPFPCPAEGKVAVEGPHYPEPHKWYAQVIVKDYIIVKVVA